MAPAIDERLKHLRHSLRCVEHRYQDLLDFSRQLLGARELEEIYRLCNRWSKKLLSLDCATLLWFDRKQRCFKVRDSIGGLAPEMIRSLVISENEGLPSITLRTGKPAVSVNIVNDPRFRVPPAVARQGITSALCVPMLHEETLLGVLVGHTVARRRFSKNDTELYQLLANQTAFAIVSRMFRDQQHQSDKLLHTIFNALAHPFYCLDRQGCYLQCNQAFCRFVGLAEEEIIGRNAAEICRRYNIEPAWPDALRMQKDTPVIHQTVWQLPGGESREVMVVRMSHGTGAENIGQIGIIVDIGSRLQVEKALEESETRYRQLFENLDSGVVVFTASGQEEDFVCVDFNRAAENIEGMYREEAVGKTLLELFPGAAEFGLLSLVQEVHRTGRSQHQPVRYYRDERVSGWREYFVYSLSGGREVVLMYSDQTERILAQQALYRSNTEYSAIFNAISDAVIYVDTERRIRQANPAFTRIFGYTLEEVIGRKSRLVYAREEDFEEQGRLRYNPDSADDQPWYVVEYRRKDGTIFSGETKGVHLRDSSGRIMGFLAVVRDISERLQATEKQRQLERQMQHVQKLESLGVLAGGIAHDFNNLLMSILGNADLALLDLPLGSPVRENLLEITATARQAAELCRQMLAYAGQGQLLPELIDCNSLIRDTMKMLKVSISKKALIHTNLASDLALVEADLGQLRQIVMNLVINASEALENDSGIITITTGTISCNQDYLDELFFSDSMIPGTYTYFEVRDTGCGMDEDTVERMFDPFFTTKFTGRGLGMAAVLGIVRQHRGGLDLKTRKHFGTTIRVLIPATDQLASSLAAKEKTGTADQWSGNGLVLLVDDEKSVRHVGKKMLELLGFTVMTAENGQEGVQKFIQYKDKVNFVLMDMTMPRMNGVEASQEMRRQKKDVRVVLASGYNEQEVTSQAGNGLAGFIQKPFQLAELRQLFLKISSG